MTLKPGLFSPFQICLSDPRGRKTEWYLQLDGGFSASQIDFLSDDAQNIYIRNVGKKIGDFDEQRDWKGGRGGEYFTDDPSKFYDAMNCWTLSTGHVTPTLLWQYGTGYRSVIQYMPGASKSVSWQALLGSTRFVASEALQSLTACDKCKIWIRRIGSPGTATLELRAADAGSPNGAVRKSATVTTSNITDVISVLQDFDWTGTQNVTSGDFFVIYGASTDNAQNHWEVGVDAAASASVTSSTGTGSWSAATFSLYYRGTDADTARRWFFFRNYTTFCAVDSKDSGASQLYTCDTAGAFTEKATTGLGTVSGRPAVVNGNTVYFPQGEGTNIRTWDGNTTYGDDGTNRATFLDVGYLAGTGVKVWRANSAQGSATTVSSAPVASPLVFGTAITIGNNNAPITGLKSWTDNGVYVFKTDSLWKVTYNGTADVATRQDFGMDNTPSASNGTFALSFQQFLYFPWLFSLERLYPSSPPQVDDIGQGWEGAGLPAGREGSFAAGCSYVGFQFYALDAGASGTSCVMCYDGVTWHEVFRAPAAGLRVRDVAIQPISGARAKLWIDCGGDLIYVILPLNKARPIDDTSSMYMHEGVLYSSTIDAGAASKLPKLIKSLTATTKNLNGSGIRIECEYQVDDDIGKDGFANWIRVQPFLISPEDTVAINAANITQFRYRLRLLTNSNTAPPDLKGIVPNGLARGTARPVYALRVKGDKITVGGKTSDPDSLLAYLIEAQQNPGTVLMTSTNPLFHNKYVEVALQRIQPVTDNKSVFTLNLVSL